MLSITFATQVIVLMFGSELESHGAPVSSRGRLLRNDVQVLGIGKDAGGSRSVPVLPNVVGNFGSNVSTVSGGDVVVCTSIHAS